MHATIQVSLIGHINQCIQSRSSLAQSIEQCRFSLFSFKSMQWNFKLSIMYILLILIYSLCAPTADAVRAKATFHDFGIDAGVACQGQGPKNDQEILVSAAIEASVFDRKPSSCGTCVRVVGPKGSIVARIIDRCGGCQTNGIDLSRQGFRLIANEIDGIVDVEWDPVSCDGLNRAPVGSSPAPSSSVRPELVSAKPSIPVVSANGTTTASRSTTLTSKAIATTTSAKATVTVVPPPSSPPKDKVSDGKTPDLTFNSRKSAFVFKNALENSSSSVLKHTLMAVWISIFFFCSL
jgi:hypothetical protein